MLSDSSSDPSRHARAGLVDARAVDPALRVDLRYAGSDNLLGAPLYTDMDACYLRPEAAAKLARADSLLRASRPDLRLLLLDCTRPLSAQRKLWELVRRTPKRPYVADPAKGSMHNYGVAVDLTLATADGRELDMGCPYDFLGPLAQPREEPRLVRKGLLSAEQLANRRLLRRVMVAAGFHPLPIEWWHFDAVRKSDARRRYRPVE